LTPRLYTPNNTSYTGVVLGIILPLLIVGLAIGGYAFYRNWKAKKKAAGPVIGQKEQALLSANTL
jgi:hypothetical protein